MEILVDYLSFTDKKYSIDYWQTFLGIDAVSFEESTSRNSYGWDNYLYYHGIHLRYGGRDDVSLEFTGTGCRFLEECNGCDLDWYTFLCFLSNLPSVNVSRLDIACDDKDNILSMKKIYSHTQSRKYISRARRCVWINGSEQEILFGSSKSSTRLRIYNKALERKVNIHWIRCEFQLRDEAADSFLENLKLQNSIGVTYAGVLLNYLRYTVSPPDINNNNSFIDTVIWWRKFTNEAEKISNIKAGGLEYNFEGLVSLIKTQYASSLKTYVELCGGDLTPLADIINSAQLSHKQKLLIENQQGNITKRKKDLENVRRNSSPAT